MQEKKNTKERKNRLRIAFTKMSLMAMLLIVSTYAWFTSQHDVTLSNLRGTVEVQENMEISLDAKSWSQKIDLSDAVTVFEKAQESKDRVIPGTAKALLPSQLLPVSGVGELNEEIMPLYGGTATGTSLNEIGKYLEEHPTDEVDNGYFTFDIYIKNTSKDGEDDILQLNLNSAVQVLTQGVAKVVDGNELKTYTRKAASGLQNTVRVGLALYDETTSSTATQAEILAETKTATIRDLAIWEPNASDHVEYIVENNNKLINESEGNKIEFTSSQQVDTYALNGSSVTAGNIENIYDISSEGLALQKTFKTEKTSEADYRVLSTNGKPLNIKSIKEELGSQKDFKITSNTVSRLRVYVWLEGQDVDCINIASEGGGIELDLGLTKDDEVGDVLKEGELNLQTSYAYDEDAGEVTVTVRTTQELELPDNTWSYEQIAVAKQQIYQVASTENIKLATEITENKKAIQKTFDIDDDISANIEITSVGGVKDKLQFKVQKTSSNSLRMINTKYSTVSNTTGKVIATIKSDKQIAELPSGWIYVNENKTEIYKEYTENTTENVTIKDIEGNEIITEVKIENIVEETDDDEGASASGVIPEGGTYIIGEKSCWLCMAILTQPFETCYCGDVETQEIITLTTGDNFPSVPSEQDRYVFGDYEYIYKLRFSNETGGAFLNIHTDGWFAKVRNYSKEKYEDIILTSICNKNVTSLDYAFCGCTELKDISNLTLPSTLNSMSNIFSGCKKITDISGLTIPDNVKSMNSTFSGCTGITDISGLTIPDSVTDMYRTFYKCTNLTDILGLTISDSVINMNETFLGCTEIADISGLTIPNSVKNLYSTFEGCTNLTGTINILTNNLSNTNSCFKNTTKPITLIGTGFNDDVLELLKNTANNGNVTY